MNSPDALIQYQEWRLAECVLRSEELRRQRKQQAIQLSQDRQLFAKARRRSAALQRSENAAQKRARDERARHNFRRDFPDFAVFSRNHCCYLDDAARICSDDPARLITFRSRLRWAGAAEALEWLGRTPIYFAVIGKGLRLSHRAWLEHIVLDPVMRQPETEWALSHSLRGSDGGYMEKLWSAQRRVHTLYLISNCERFPFRVSARSLVKIADMRRLSADYKYSYSLVREIVEP